MSFLRRQAAKGRLRKGTTARVSRTFTKEDLQAFGRITRDYNPVHYEPRWVEGKGFDGLIHHGLLVGSMLCEPGGQWGLLAADMSFTFRRPVYVGDTITCEMTITEITGRCRARVKCEFTNQHDQVVMWAEVSGYLPNRSEQDLLRQMLAEGDPTNKLSD